MDLCKEDGSSAYAKPPGCGPGILEALLLVLGELFHKML